MGESLPTLFVVASGIGLVAALFAFWRSVHGALVGTADAGLDVPLAPERARLLDEKAALLRGIKELAFERDAGKISQEDFDRVDAAMRLRAREVLEALDREVEPFREKAEALIAKRTRAPGTKDEPKTGEMAHECAGCGTRNDDDAAFCKRCGRGLA